MNRFVKVVSREMFLIWDEPTERTVYKNSKWTGNIYLLVSKQITNWWGGQTHINSAWQEAEYNPYNEYISSYTKSQSMSSAISKPSWTDCSDLCRKKVHLDNSTVKLLVIKHAPCVWRAYTNTWIPLYSL